MSDTVADPPAPSPSHDVVAHARHDSHADRLMLHLLRLPIDAPKATAAEARNAFRTSLMVTTVRCLLMYILLPFVLPLVGIATGAAPAIVLPINIVAIVMIVMSIRRFWRADHSKRWWYTALGTTVIAFLAASTVAEVVDLLT